MHHWLVDLLALRRTEPDLPSGSPRIALLRAAHVLLRGVALAVDARPTVGLRPRRRPVAPRVRTPRVPALPAPTPVAVRGVALAAAGLLTVGLVAGALVRLDPATRADSPVAADADLTRVESGAPGEGEPAGDGASGGGAPDDDQGSTSARPEPEAESEANAEVAGATVTRDEPTLLPTGKGMWFNRLEYTADGPEEIVARAQATGLTHLYVRTGSSKGGFYAQGDLDRLLPVAHAAGLKVVGWDFPYLDDPVADAHRALAAISYETPDGHRIDAFSADIETRSEGVQLTAERVDAYGGTLRELVGPDYPLIGTVPNACLARSFPFDRVAAHFDAFAPMVYWITRDPAADVACNMRTLSAFEKPLLPIGQAYDPAIDNPELVGWVPRYEHLAAFMAEAARQGAPGVSFWVWHTATPEMWQAIADSGAFTLSTMGPGHPEQQRVAALQRLLAAYGYETPVDGRYDDTTAEALAALQADLGLPATGDLDADTLGALLGPRGAGALLGR